jgi:hypothetical protein
MAKRIGFRSVVMIGGTVLMLVPAFVAGWIYTGSLQREAERLVVNALQARGEIATQQFARRLYTLWTTVDRFATSLSTEPADMKQDFTLLARLDDRMSWLGLADTSGKVLAASHDMLEGQDVSQRPWFRRGLAGAFAGDVHEAVLLARLMGRADEPLRFVDFSAPVRDNSGAIKGVVGLHINWSWITDYLAGLSTGGKQVILLSRDRRVLHGPPDLVDRPLSIGAAVAASQGRALTRPEQWPDGKSYMTAVVPTVSYREMPDFGWSILVREDMNGVVGPTRELVREFWLTLGAGALISMVLLFLGATWLATPLRRLSAFGRRLSTGDATAAPHEETRYREATELSASLVRLQSRLASDDAPLQPDLATLGRSDETPARPSLTPRG